MSIFSDEMRAAIDAEIEEIKEQNRDILELLTLSDCDLLVLDGFTEQISPVFKDYQVFACGNYQSDFVFGVHLSQLLLPTFLELLNKEHGTTQASFISDHVITHLPTDKKYSGLTAGFYHGLEVSAKMAGESINAMGVIQ